MVFEDEHNENVSVGLQGQGDISAEDSREILYLELFVLAISPT